MCQGMASDYLCPHCGSRVDTDPDSGGGEFQDYIEDCPICCRPNRLQARLVVDESGYVVEAFGDA